MQGTQIMSMLVNFITARVGVASIGFLIYVATELSSLRSFWPRNLTMAASLICFVPQKSAEEIFELRAEGEAHEIGGCG